MPANYVLLQEITTNTTVASVTISNIPQTGYTDLVLKISAKDDTAGNITAARIRPNGLTTNLSSKRLYGVSPSPGSDSPAGWLMLTNGANAANTFGNSELYIPNYTSSNSKSAIIDATMEINSSSGYEIELIGGLWSNSAAITSLGIFPQSGNWVANSTFSLYGIAKVGTTPVIVPKASGGDIITNDGTYWYHAFLASGVFIPNQELTCDTLVVAGGGGGQSSSNWNGYGGGGAGGLIYKYSSAINAGSYAVVIGAGGASDRSGSNSTFNSLSAFGGGTANGSASGGSGGGGGGRGTPAPPGGASTQTSNNGGTGKGNAGGAAQPGDNGAYTNAGGGGGGAGAAGGNAGSPYLRGGAGGIGWTDSVINAMGAATNTGQLSGGNYYFAGGAAGVSSDGTTAAVGLGGGGQSDVTSGVAGTTYNTKTAGTINTGGGGGSAQYGGGGTDYAGKAGGSGIVIVRYTMA